MPTLKLCTGLRILSEHGQRAEPYGSGSVRSHRVICVLLSKSSGVLAARDKYFIYISAANGAAQNASALEQAGIRVYRGRPCATMTAGITRASCVSRPSASQRARVTSEQARLPIVAECRAKWIVSHPAQ
jgi:hypothetical protein